MSQMLATWHFTPQHPQYKSREAFQGQFFTTPSIDNVADSVVRESVQNTLDAHDESDKRPRIVFRLFSEPGLPADSVAPFVDQLWPHLDACVDASSSLRSESHVRTLIVEDFNTRGLTGDPACQFEPPDKESNHFYYFFRAEGRSSKSGSSRGSWGIGKFTFVQASEINAFFGYTYRVGPDAQPGGTGPLLMGESIMASHRLGGKAYTPDGWWADYRRIGDFDTPMPIAGGAQTDRFEEVFHLDRGYRPGLSVVVPYVHREMTGDSLRRAIVKNYAVAVSQGLVDIELRVDDRKRVYFNASTIDAAVRELADDPLIADVRSHVDLVRAVSNDRVETIAVDQLSADNRWSSADGLSVEVRRELMAAQLSSRPFVVRVPVRIDRKARSAEPEVGEALVAFSPSDAPSSAYYRGGLRISEVRGKPIQGFQAVVVAGTDALGAFLGNAEGPSHVDWSARTERFSGAYAQGQGILATIKNLPSIILRAGRSIENRTDRDLAIQFFRRPDRPTGRPDRGSDGSGGDKELDIQSSNRRFTVAKIAGGFRASAPPSAKSGDRFVFRCAYGVRSGRPLKRWSPADFDLADLSVLDKGCEITKCEGNTIEGIITEPGEFRLDVTGFDGIRDLFVDPVLIDEVLGGGALR